MSINEFLGNVGKVIINPIIILAFAVALLVFFWGIFQFISSETADTKRDEGKKKIFFGLIGMFIMISAYGLIRLILGTFGITPSHYPFN
ncbi:MAG: hypothetical protein HYT69_00945 [Candidatus Zambryskibacteria bacterium]|nr:hypothetical protein [Candidatus Zambryskibacteria bacterium]